MGDLSVNRPLWMHLCRSRDFVSWVHVCMECVCSGCCPTRHTPLRNNLCAAQCLGLEGNNDCFNVVQGACSVCVSDRPFVEAAACAGQCTAGASHKGGHSIAIWMHESKAARCLHALMSCVHWLVEAVCVGHCGGLLRQLSCT